jgi:hypothetical protein
MNAHGKERGYAVEREEAGRYATFRRAWRVTTGTMPSSRDAKSETMWWRVTEGDEHAREKREKRVTHQQNRQPLVLWSGLGRLDQALQSRRRHQTPRPRVADLYHNGVVYLSKKLVAVMIYMRVHKISMKRVQSPSKMKVVR